MAWGKSGDDGVLAAPGGERGGVGRLLGGERGGVSEWLRDWSEREEGLRDWSGKTRGLFCKNDTATSKLERMEHEVV